MIRALACTALLTLLVGCGGGPAGGAAGTPIPGLEGDASACAFAQTDDPHEAFTLLDARYQELIAELEEDLEAAEDQEEQQEIYAEMAAVDAACLAALGTISFPSRANSSVGPASRALEDVALSRLAIADAATEEEFEDAVHALEDSVSDWRMWRNALLLSLR